MTVNNTPEVGKVYEGKVKRMLNFGAFVEILPGVEGLIHVSQLAPVRVAQPEDILEIGAIIDVKCIEFTDETLRLTMLDVEQLNEKVANRIMRAIIKGDAPVQKREDRGDRKPRSFGDKPRGDRPRRDGDRPNRSFGDKPRGDRDSRPARDGERKFSDKPRGDRPRRDNDNKPRTDRPRRDFGDKPRNDRPRRDNDDRPRRDGDKPNRSFSDKPRSDRPKSNFGDKKRSFSNKPNRSR